MVKWKKLITEDGIRDISKLLVNVAMPALVISSMSIEYSDEHAKNMLILAVLSVIYLLFITLFSSKLSHFLKGEEKERKAMHYCMIFGNTAFLGYPIAQALFGEVGMLYASVYIAAQNVFQWTVGVNIYKRERIRLSNLKNLLNPGIIAIIIGLAFFIFDVRIPDLMSKVLKGTGNISIPLALIIIGATLQGMSIWQAASDYRILIVSILKTFAYPAAYLGAIYFLPVDNIIKSILTIQAAAPIQASAVAFAKSFDGDVTIPAKGVLVSTSVCLLTIPLLLLLINR
jgi:predicted permease